MGFAFVNCVDVTSTHRLLDMCMPVWDVSSHRKIKVVYAHVQGLALNVADYIGSSLAEDGRDHQPVVFENRMPASFNEAVLRFVPPELAAGRLREADAAKRSGFIVEPPQAPNSFPGRNISWSNRPCSSSTSGMTPPGSGPPPGCHRAPNSSPGRNCGRSNRPSSSSSCAPEGSLTLLARMEARLR